jgi:GcrA cell cycle regulator
MVSWTEERVELLQKLWSEDSSASQIAAELGGGISRSAVMGKIHRLGLCGRGHTTSVVKQERKKQFTGSRLYRLATIGSFALRARPKTVPEREPKIFEPVVVPVAKMLTVAALTQHTCKWPIGDNRDGGFRFCGHDTLAGVPYCRYHTTIAYRAGR